MSRPEEEKEERKPAAEPEQENAPTEDEGPDAAELDQDPAYNPNVPVGPETATVSGCVEVEEGTVDAYPPLMPLKLGSFGL